MASELAVPPPLINRPVDCSPIVLAHRLPRPIAYVLAGGGAHGSVQWGLLQALAETDIAPDLLVGTSAGALTAAVYAEDPIAAVTRLSYVWSQLTSDSLFGDSWVTMLRAATSRKRSIVDSRAVAGAIRGIVHSETFTDLAVPTYVVATNLATGAATTFDHGDLLSALLASSAIPGLLPPVERDGEIFIDGLASANVPVLQALDHGAKSIIVLDTGTRAPSEPNSSARWVASQTNRILMTNQRRAHLLHAALSVPTLVLPTPKNLGASLDFTGTHRAAADSYLGARDFLVALHHTIGKRGQLGPGIYADSIPQLHAVGDAPRAVLIQPRGPA